MSSRPNAVAYLAVAMVVMMPLITVAQSTTMTRTPWGDPDLQGIWNNSTTTPFERLTASEQERGRLAQEQVSRATGGTGAAWIELRGLLAPVVEKARRGVVRDREDDDGRQETHRTLQSPASLETPQQDPRHHEYHGEADQDLKKLVGD